jgi:uncharacterized membrane protein (DUF106 family)
MKADTLINDLLKKDLELKKKEMRGQEKKKEPEMIPTLEETRDKAARDQLQLQYQQLVAVSCSCYFIRLNASSVDAL